VFETRALRLIMDFAISLSVTIPTTISFSITGSLPRSLSIIRRLAWETRSAGLTVIGSSITSAAYPLVKEAFSSIS
jgi:hypothetical protein